MNAAKKTAAKKTPTKKTVAKKTPTKKTGAARNRSSGSADGSDRELGQALVDLQGRRAEWWPCTSGLGQMQMWWRAYTMRILPTDESADPGAYGLIAD